MVKLRVFLIFVFVSSLAYAKAPPTPSWMNNVRTAYPDSKYIAQKGSGKKIEQAKTDALSKIAQYIKTSVESNLSTSLRSIDDGKNFTETTQVQNDVAVTSNVQLLGVEYSEAYYSKQEKKYFCVAYIERAYAWKQFAPKIEQEKTSFYEFYNEALTQAEQEPLLAAKYFALAKNQGAKFIAALEYGRLLSEEREKAYQQDRATVASINKRQADAALKSVLFLNINGDYSDIIGTKVQTELSSAGLNISKDKRKSSYILDVQIKSNMEVEGAGTETALYTAYPSVSISITGTNSAKPIFTYSKKISSKTVAYSKEVVLKKSLPLLAQEIESSLIKEFNAAIGAE